MSPLSLLCALLLVFTALADVTDELQQDDRDVLQLSDDGTSSGSAAKRARNPYSWMVTGQSKRARNPYSWMAHPKVRGIEV
ncbi:hypothetical protein GCK32_012885 [Trichostrongylus colubriformis]|uniref:Uncharacterized protein n=1 Tax=Trichostrongylus colubriformis TaxID=6319 RepID=A0AAN8F7K6_TRICO